MRDVQYWMKVSLGSNFEDQNVENETLGNKVRQQADFRGVKGQFPKLLK